MLEVPNDSSSPEVKKHVLRLLPSGYVKIAIENGHLYWIFPLKMVIFHCYVSLPEGTKCGFSPSFDSFYGHFVC